MLVNTSHDWANMVRDRRADLGLTQADLAQRIGRARQWVVRFESGHSGSASVDSLMAVLNALDLYAEVDTSEASVEPDPMFVDVIYPWVPPKSQPQDSPGHSHRPIDGPPGPVGP